MAQITLVLQWFFILKIKSDHMLAFKFSKCIHGINRKFNYDFS